MADDQLLTPVEFAQTIKAKYPDYATVPDEELAAKMLAKYPEYQARIRTPDFKTVNEKDDQGNPIVDFASHALAAVDPIAAVQAVGKALPIPQALGGEGVVRGPVNFVKGLGAAQGALYEKAKGSYEQGDYVTAARHFIDYLLPIVGPPLDQAADRMQQGKYAQGAGDAVGLGLAMFGPELVKAGASRMAGAAPKVADRAQAGATERLAQIITPSGSSREIRQLGRQATQIAPDVLRGTSAITPGGLGAQIATRFENATDALDAAYSALPKTGYSTQPLLNQLRAAVDRLTVKGSSGQTVSANVADRVGAIQQAIKEVQDLGPYTNTENLATLRNQWKDGAKAAFVPEVNPNYLQLRNAAKGWADAWSTLQDTLTDRHPELKPLNADYRVWKQASDVLDALTDRERVRPTVGRSIMASAAGSMVGGAAEGPLGAAVGGVVGPLVERGLAGRVGPTMKLVIARQLQSLADALRSGNTPKATQLLQTLRPMLVAATGTSEALPRAADQAPAQSAPAQAGPP